MAMQRFNFFLGVDQYEALGRAAERRRVSRSHLLRDILDRVLKLTPPVSEPQPYNERPTNHDTAEAGQ
jgi:hypothetical protein